MLELTTTKRNIADELDLIISKKLKDDDFCWACGPAGDLQEIGAERYMVTASFLNKDKDPEFEYLEWCPKHFAFLLNIALTHIMRVEKGKEKGPLTLGQLQQAGEIT